MATSSTPVNPGTQRKDGWSLEPTLIFLGFLCFIVYATARAFEGNFFMVEGTNYLSPFYSPYIPHLLKLVGLTYPQEWISSKPWLAWITPAFFILWAPAGFRTTCYYYRKAYYRAFFGSPAGCAVGDPSGNALFDVQANTLGRLLGRGRNYLGEKAFPLVLQNLHRYFFYVAALFIVILSWDALVAFFGTTGTGENRHIDWGTIQVGLGSLVLAINVILLALYTFSCHSYRHLLGGQVDCFSTCPMGPERHHAYERQSMLNEHHMEFAWLSLFSVGFADLYVRMVSAGVWTDPRLLNWHWAWWG